MAFVDEFRDLFQDTCSWAVKSSLDTYAKPTYAAPTSGIVGRLVVRNKMVRSKEGDQVLSSSHFWMMGDYAVDPEDQITLADGSTPPILSVERIPDENGDKHTKVYFR